MKVHSEHSEPISEHTATAATAENNDYPDWLQLGIFTSVRKRGTRKPPENLPENLSENLSEICLKT